MDRPIGPDPDTLKQLHGMLPSFAKGMAEKRTLGRGKPVAAAKPRQMCTICLTQFDFATVQGEMPIRPGRCERCEKLLAEGYTALTCGDQYAFVKIPKNPELAGQVVPLSGANFTKIKERYENDQDAAGQG